MAASSSTTPIVVRSMVAPALARECAALCTGRAGDRGAAGTALVDAREAQPRGFAGTTATDRGGAPSGGTMPGGGLALLLKPSCSDMSPLVSDAHDIAVETFIYAYPLVLT